jgi:hypothetical protein
MDESPKKLEVSEPSQTHIMTRQEMEIEQLRLAAERNKEVQEALKAQTCPACGRPHRTGELVCSACGTVFLTAGKTTKFDESTHNLDARNYPRGEVLATERAPVILEIDGKPVKIEVVERTVIGRNVDGYTDSGPDVDLTPHRAGELGVSRRHARIRRNGALLYIADLNSTNGTQLNGRKLIPEGERLLRNGDEIRLGHLRIKIKF